MKKNGCEKAEDLQKIYEARAKDAQMVKPKYIYLNTLAAEKKELVEQLKADKFARVKNSRGGEDCEAGVRAVIKGLRSDQFVKDEFIQNMLVFSADSLLNKNYHLFEAGHLMQIDKVGAFVRLLCYACG